MVVQVVVIVIVYYNNNNDYKCQQFTPIFNLTGEVFWSSSRTGLRRCHLPVYVFCYLSCHFAPLPLTP